LRWIFDEAKDKKKIIIDQNEWKLIESEANVPQQNNSFDCGVFIIMFADFLADDLPIDSFS